MNDVDEQFFLLLVPFFPAVLGLSEEAVDMVLEKGEGLSAEQRL